MCGIIGLYGDDLNVHTSDHKDFISEGLIIDTLRGFDSTGIACVPRWTKEGVQVYKKAMAGYDFIQLKKANKLIDQMHSHLAVLGHNRSATRGNVTDNNSHPFQYGHITLVHNGTVSNAESLVPKKDRPDIWVDSALVAHAFAHETAEDMLPKLTGGYSLVWWDDSDHSLNFARNEAKPMYIAFHKTRQVIYFGSEAEMIVLLCRRNNLPIQDTIFNVVPDVHYKFKDPKNVREVIKTPFVKRPAYTVYQGGKTHNGSGGHTQGVWNPTKESQTTTPTTPTGGTTGTGGAVVPITKTSYNAAHPVREEVFTRLQTTALKQEVMSDDRKKVLKDLLAEYKLSDKHIVAKPYFWKPYKQLNKNDNVPVTGFMLCEPVYKDAKDKGDIFLQVFDVSHKRWANEFNDQNVVLLQPVSYRNNVKLQGFAPVLVCRIREDLHQKHFHPKRNEQGVSGEEEGTKSDWIEIGTGKKRLVPPNVFAKLCSTGCVNCTQSITLENLKDFQWIGPNEDKPICDFCSDNPLVLESLRNVV